MRNRIALMISLFLSIIIATIIIKFVMSGFILSLIPGWNTTINQNISIFSFLVGILAFSVLTFIICFKIIKQIMD